MSSSAPFSITINPSGVIPANTVVLIGSNTLYSTMDSGAGFVQNEGSASSNEWSTATFGAYGGGAFCPDYGPQGAYIIAGTGGHVGASVFDAVAFDFETELWTRLVNTNGVANLSNYVPTSAQLDAYGQYNGCRAPAHNYFTQIGVGADIVVPFQIYISQENASSMYPFKFVTDRDNPQGPRGTWVRVSDSTLNNPYTIAENGVVYDSRAGQNKAYFFAQGLVSPLRVYNVTTGQWDNNVSIPSPTNPATSTPGQYFSFHYLIHHSATQHCLLCFRSNGTNFSILNLDNVAAGWTIRTTMSGTLPTFSSVRWAYYDPAYGGDGCHYAMPREGSGTTIWKLTPPDDLFTGTWSFSQINLPTSPPWPQRTTRTLAHYTCFFFVPARQCFAWIAAGSKQVALWRP